MGFPILKVNKGKKRASTIVFKGFFILALILIPFVSFGAPLLFSNTTLTTSRTNNTFFGIRFFGINPPDWVITQMDIYVSGFIGAGASATWCVNARPSSPTNSTCLSTAKTMTTGWNTFTLTTPIYLSSYGNDMRISILRHSGSGQMNNYTGAAVAPPTDKYYSYHDSGSDLNYPAIRLWGYNAEDYTDTSTRIIEFNPQDGSVEASTSVTFSIDAYINAEDVGDVLGVNISLHNIDQNGLGWLLGDFSPSDFYVVDERIDTAGLFSFSTSTPLADGNYRVEACLERSYFFGWVTNPWANIIDGERDCQSHQFIVGTSTFLGSLTQNGFTEYNDFINGLTATSTEALASTCNPLNGNFGIRECMTYLFVPGGEALNNTLQGLREGVLTRVPWGYFTRAVTILSGTATSSLPTFTTNIRFGESDYEELTFDPGDMLIGAGNLVDSIEDPIHGATFRDIFYTLIQLVVAIGVIFTILMDITKSHHDNNHNNRE